MVIKHSLLTFLMLCSYMTVFAQTNEEENIDIPGWINEIRGSEKERIMDQYVFAMVRSIDTTGPIFFKAKYDELNQQGLLRFIGPKEWQLFKKMNPKMKELSKKKVRKYIFQATGASKALICTKSTCRYQYLNGKILKTIKKWKFPKARSTKRWISWWKKQLGFSGIVIDVKGAFHLVATISPINPGFSHALAFQNSADLNFINQKKQKGNALLELVKSEGNLGVYKLILGESQGSGLPLGTKVIIDETRSKKKKATE